MSAGETMNATELVNAPLGPEAKAFVARSNAERLWLPKCVSCDEAQSSYDQQIGFLDSFMTSKEAAKKLGIGERPAAHESKWWVNYYPVEGIAPVEQAICEHCLQSFAKEKTREYNTRCAGLPGRHEAQLIHASPIVPSNPDERTGLIRAEKGSPCYLYDPDSEEWEELGTKESPKKYPPKKK